MKHRAIFQSFIQHVFDRLIDKIGYFLLNHVVRLEVPVQRIETGLAEMTAVSEQGFQDAGLVKLLLQFTPCVLFVESNGGALAVPIDTMQFQREVLISVFFCETQIQRLGAVGASQGEFAVADFFTNRSVFQRKLTHVFFRVTGLVQFFLFEFLGKLLDFVTEWDLSNKEVEMAAQLGFDQCQVGRTFSQFRLEGLLRRLGHAFR